MGNLQLRYAGVSYFDKTRAIERGEVKPEGIDLEYVEFNTVGDLFRIMAQEPETFDAAEMSLSTLTMMISRGDDRLVGFPVFPSKAFRHSQVYVHADSGIERPEDLIGRKVGIPEYQMTAAVWIRAFLEHDYGVHPSQVQWFTGGYRTPVYVERMHHEPPAGVSIERIPEDRTLLSMLDEGELEALVTAGQPEVFTADTGRVRRLFPDYRTVEENYLARTGIYPVMHTAVVRRDVYEANPWVALSLLNAFEEAKHHGRHRLRDLDTLAAMHPWIAAELDELKGPFERFGGDPFAYGIPTNRHVLDALMDYSHEQGLSDRRIAVEELYAPETYDWTSPPARDEPPA